ncbi:MAG: excisionase family protein [Pleurocapsa sp.]
MTSIIKKQISEPGVSQNWVNKNIAAKILGISTHTLKLYRKKHWTLGIHFQYLNSRTIRYHEGLIRDWFANIADRQAHQWAIQVYLASLLSN